MLASALDRRVEFNDETGSQSGVRVGLLGGVRVTAQRIEIGAPAWSKEPHTLLARDARLRLGYLDLWRAWRGEPLRIKDLHARELDGVLERLADGRASWQFGKRAANSAENAGETSLPDFSKLRVGQRKRGVGGWGLRAVFVLRRIADQHVNQHEVWTPPFDNVRCGAGPDLVLHPGAAIAKEHVVGAL